MKYVQEYEEIKRKLTLGAPYKKVGKRKLIKREIHLI